MLAAGWESVTSPDGQVYYYNKDLDRTQWERPTTSSTTSSGGQHDIEAQSATPASADFMFGSLSTAAFEKTVEGYGGMTDEGILARLMCTLTFWKSPATIEEFTEKPDFVAPLWIVVTLGLCVFAADHLEQLGATGTIARSYIVALPASWLMLLSWTLCAPLFIRYVYNSRSGDQASTDLFKYSSLVCIHGYSLLPAVPAVLVAALPSWPLRIASLVGASCYGLYFAQVALQNDLIRIFEPVKTAVRITLIVDYAVLYFLFLLL